MHRAAVAFLFILLGVAAASMAWWTFARPQPRSDPTPRSDAWIAEALARLETRIDDLADVVGRSQRIPAALPPEAESRPDQDLAAILARLTAIEAALAREPGRAAPVPVAPAEKIRPKPKDQELVVQVAARGGRDATANLSEYLAWSPRDVYETFGKPDGTNLSKELGWLDWFYWSPDGRGALQFRFEGGAVIGVWP